MSDSTKGQTSILKKKVDISWQEQREMALKARALGAELRKGKMIGLQRTLGKIS